MTAVAAYLLAEHFRSRRFVAPFLLLVAGVVVLYSQPPNPVLPTAGTVAAFVFVDVSWFALATLNTQSAGDRQLLSVVAGAREYALGRLLAVVALAGTISVAAVAFPTLAGLFERTPTVTELALCLLGTLVCALAGAALGALFSRPLVRSRAIAVLGLTASLVLTIPLGLSPAIATAHALDVKQPATAVSRLAPTLVSVSLFALAVAVACVFVWRQRE